MAKKVDLKARLHHESTGVSRKPSQNSSIHKKTKVSQKPAKIKAMPESPLEKNSKHEAEPEEAPVLRDKIGVPCHIVGFFAMILLCVYVVFLIYGVLCTEFVYDDNGRVVPNIMTVSERREYAQFNSLMVQYEQSRTLYEQILLLDYRVEKGQESYAVLAANYENMLEDIEKLVIQIEALSLPSKYMSLQTMLTQWVANDAAVYCQNISKALLYNNATYAGNAVEYKKYCYNDFSLITENFISIGGKVKGCDISSLTTWSPEGYIKDKVGM